jgi:hypothetical protein
MVINGTDLRIWIDDVLVADATSHSLSVKMGSRKATTKDTNRFGRAASRRLDVTGTSEALMVYGNFETIYSAMVKQSPVKIDLGNISEEDDSLNQLLTYATGNFLITGLDKTDPDDDNSSYTITFDLYSNFNFYENSWNPEIVIDGETPNFWIKEDSRSGLTLTDSVAANNASILPAHLKNDTSGLCAFYVADNGALNVDNNADLTLFGWVKAETTNKNTYWRIMGKDVSGNTSGSYFFVALGDGTGDLYAYIATSGGAYPVGGHIDDWTTQGWMHLLLEIDTSEKKARWFQNGVQVGSDTTYTGTFGSLGNEFEFCISGQNLSNGSGFSSANKAPASFSDVGVIKAILTTEQKTDLIAGTIPDGCAAYYPLNDLNGFDCSGNGLHLSKSYTDPNYPLTLSNIAFSQYGSKHPLNIGYSLFKKPGAMPIQVPYNTDGTVLSTPSTMPSGYTFSANFVGDLLNHNLASSMIQFTGDEWDRSDTDLFCPSARVAILDFNGSFYNSTNATTKKQWHISELNKNILNSYCKQGNYGRNWVKGDGNTIDNRLNITDIFTYLTDKTGQDYSLLNTFCGDDGKSYYIEYSFTTDDIVAVRGTKILRFNHTSQNLELSIDNGATYPYTISMSGLITSVDFAYIFSNGNILWAYDDKIYLSTDNLATKVVPTVTGADGNTFVPSTVDNWKTIFNVSNLSLYGYDDFLIWGCYSTTTPPCTSNMNVWLSKDNGVSIKSIWKGNYTAVQPAGTGYSLRHTHGIYYLEGKDEFILLTGDSGAECAWIKGKYNSTLDSWVWTLLDASETYCKSGGMAIYDNYLYWGGDSPAPYNAAAFRCLYTDIGVHENYQKLFPQSSVSHRDANGVYDFGDGTMIINEFYMGTNEPACWYISIDRGITWIRHDFIHTYSFITAGGFFPVSLPKTDGYSFVEIAEYSEGLSKFFGGDSMWFRIVKS